MRQIPVFEYEGKTDDGEPVADTIQAPSRAVAVVRLRQQGIWIDRLDEVGKQPRRAQRTPERPEAGLRIQWAWWYGLNTVSAAAMRDFFEQLGTLYRAGVSTLTIVEQLSARVSSGRLRRVLQQCSPAIQEGRSLSDCLRRYPQIFPAGITGMVKVGELTGNVDELAKVIADDYAGEQRVWLMTLLPKLYFLVVLVLAAFVSKFPMIVRESNIVLGLKKWIHYALTHVVPWLLAAVLLYFLLRILWYIPPVLRLRDRLSYSLPVWGMLTRRIALYRFYTSLRTAVRAGIDFPIAWEASADAAGNPFIVNLIRRAADRMRTGAPITQVLTECGLISTDNVGRLASAAEAGTFDEVLPRIAQEAETARTQFVRAVRIGGIIAAYVVTTIIALVALVLAWSTLYQSIFSRVGFEGLL